MMEYSEPLQISGIQHYVFCPRQWALITLEQSWQDDAATIEGQLLHKNADDPFYEEIRGNKIITRCVPVYSSRLGLTGILDVLEFKKASAGIELPGKSGKWQPTIVEHKKGKPKKNLSDTLQLVAQVVCVEEHYNCQIQYGCLFYYQTKERIKLEITHDLRLKLERVVNEMHALMKTQKTPSVSNMRACSRCSLANICWPRLTFRKKSPQNYIAQRWEELSRAEITQ